MRSAKGFYPLLLIIVFASLTSFAFATMSVDGEDIIYRGSNKGDILFDIDYYSSMIYFDNGFLMIHNFNGILSSIGFSCDTEVASMIITKVSSREIKYHVDAPTDTNSKTKIYVGSKGRPSDVRGDTSWSYNDNLKIVTVKVLHKSPAEIVLVWGGSNDARRNLISSFESDMDMLWILVMLMVTGLMLTTLRGVPLDPVLLIELIVVSIIVYIGGIILLQFITKII